jgi:hypothetical protein
MYTRCGGLRTINALATPYGAPHGRIVGKPAKWPAAHISRRMACWDRINDEIWAHPDPARAPGKPYFSAYPRSGSVPRFAELRQTVAQRVARQAE